MRRVEKNLLDFINLAIELDGLHTHKINEERLQHMQYLLKKGTAKNMFSPKLEKGHLGLWFEDTKEKFAIDIHFNQQKFIINSENLWKYIEVKQKDLDERKYS